MRVFLRNMRLKMHGMESRTPDLSDCAQRPGLHEATLSWLQNPAQHKAMLTTRIVKSVRLFPWHVDLCGLPRLTDAMARFGLYGTAI